MSHLRLAVLGFSLVLVACAQTARPREQCGEVLCNTNEQCVVDECMHLACVGVVCSRGELCAAGVCFPQSCSDRTCGVGEICNDGSCEFTRCIGVSCTSGHVCVAGECLDARCGDVLCDRSQVCESGACIDRLCAGVVCAGGQECVAGSCVGPSCLPGQYDESGSCHDQLDNGQVCTRAEMCKTGHCVDHVCCDTACGAPCDACNVTGRVGQCGLRPKGTAEPLCAPYVCDGASVSCATTCSGAADCRQGASCKRSECVVGNAGSSSCQDAIECPNGYCSDGYCCDAPCDGACDSCNVSGNRGICTLLAAGTSCGDYRCDGTSPTCPAGCVVDEQCVQGSYCDGAACQPKLAVGQACQSARECTSGYCTDGYCCNGPCSEGCAVCNKVGSLGQCQIAAAGAPGDCAPAVCSGSSVHCPLTALVDDFNDNAIDVAKWSVVLPSSSYRVAEVNQQLEITLVDGRTGYPGLTALRPYQLRDSQAVVEIASHGSFRSTKNVEVVLSAGGSRDLVLGTEGSSLRAWTRNGGGWVTEASRSFDATATRWLRIRESGGSIYFDYAASAAGPWTTLHRESVFLPIDGLTVRIDVGNWGTEYGLGMTAFDNFNVVP